jgi:hypothetical protein
LIGGGFRLSPDNLFVPLTVNPDVVLERMAISEIPIEQLVTFETMKPQIATDGNFAEVTGFHVLTSSR